MKRLIIIISAFLVALCGCSIKTAESQNSLSNASEISSGPVISANSSNELFIESDTSSKTSGNTSKSSEEESFFWSNISGIFIDYVGGRDFNVFVKEVENAKEPSGYGLFVHFCMYFNLTREEILSVMNKENEILAGMGENAYYSENRMKEVMQILFGDENIGLKQSVNVLTKRSGLYGLIFGDTEFSDAKDIENPLYYSIPPVLQHYAGVRQINKWVAGLEKREDYNIVNFVRYFGVPADVFDNAFQVLYYNAHVNNVVNGTPIILDQKFYDQVRKELYGETQTFSEVSLPDAVYQQSSVESSLPWNTPEEKSAYYASSEALMSQSQTSSEVSSTVTSQ